MLLLLIIFFSSVIVFLVSIRDKSLQSDFIEIRTKVSGTAEIYVNQQNIPHIIATDDQTMFFAMGYFHASQRL